MNNNTNNNNFNDRYNNYSDSDNTNNNIYSNSNPYQNTQTESSETFYNNEQNNNAGYNPYVSQNTNGSAQSAGNYHSESEYSYVYKKPEQDMNTTNTTQQTIPNQNIYSQNSVQLKKKSGSKGKFFAKVIAAALCFGIVAGSVMVGVNYAGSKLLSTNAGTSSKISSTSSIKTTNSDTTTQTTYDVATVVEKVMPAMVSINVKATTTIQNPYSDFFNFGFGYGGNDTYQQETSGSGSGIVISESDSELLIVTNNHVVEDATEINVTFNDKSTYSATIKGTDSDYDLAVIAVKLSDISADTKKNIAIATLGDSKTLQLGQPAVAIGNALGYGQSVTVGYISALEREVQMTDNTMTLIQTDAAINPGNSGGALLDMSGNVIGINSAKYSDTDVEGMGYAIPISDAQPIIEDLMNNTNNADAKRAYLGISGTDVTSSYSQSFGLPTGVYVSQVTEGSPASNAGIQAGDIITKFNGDEVTTMTSLQAKIKARSVGDSVEIVVQRQQRNGGYKEVKLTVTLGSKADAPQEN